MAAYRDSNVRAGVVVGVVYFGALLGLLALILWRVWQAVSLPL